VTDPSFTSAAERDLVVVAHDRDEAETARRALVAAGVPDEEILVDRPEDRAASLRGEMHEELAHSWFGAQAGFLYTKESARGLVAGGAIGGAIGIVLAFPLALIPIGDMAYGGRLVAALVLGLAFGFAIGMVAGPSVTSLRPNQPPAVERGTLLRVRRDTPEVRALLARLHPIRVDEVRRWDDLPIDTPYTEEGSPLAQTARDAALHLRANDDDAVDPDARTPSQG
jgi:hypothetical protein